MTPRRGGPVTPVDVEVLHRLWQELGAAVHASAQLMASRAVGVTADDITVAAFVAYGRGEACDGEAPLADLLRLAGRAARAGSDAMPTRRAGALT
jgi:hypothetical protein